MVMLCGWLVFGAQVTQDQFDAIDFSDNEIKKVDNFPRYRRLSSLLLCNNHVSRIAADLGAQLPNLSCLILTNNKVRLWTLIAFGVLVKGPKNAVCSPRVDRPRGFNMAIGHLLGRGGQLGS